MAQGRQHPPVAVVFSQAANLFIQQAKSASALSDVGGATHAIDTLAPSEESLKLSRTSLHGSSLAPPYVPFIMLPVFLGFQTADLCSWIPTTRGPLSMGHAVGSVLQAQGGIGAAKPRSADPGHRSFFTDTANW